MMRKIVVSIAAALACLFGGFVACSNAMAVTCPAGSLREGDSTVKSIAECNVPAKNADGSSTNAMGYMQKIINVILTVLAVVAVIVIIIAGINMMTSQGDSAKVTKAKNMILYAVIGLVIALLAFAIVNFVLKGVFSSSTGEEEITYATTKLLG